jgi:hypothetical protein
MGSIKIPSRTEIQRGNMSNKFDPKALNRRVSGMYKRGKMPPMSEFLKAMGEVRKEFQPQILKERERAEKESASKETQTSASDSTKKPARPSQK